MEIKNQLRICIPICEPDPRDWAGAIARAAEFADVIELRVDCIEEIQLDAANASIACVLGARVRPIILTFRPAGQGGHRSLTLADRIGFRTRECSWEGQQQFPDFIDLESDLAFHLDKKGKAGSAEASALPLDWNRIICSHHDFVGVPVDLVQIYERMASTPAHILKIAVQANDVIDCIPVFHLLERARKDGREIIAIAMGTAGIATRILGPSRGGFLTYAALETETSIAPGQISARELRDVYRLEKLDRQTQIFGLMGLPVSHSLSPRVHNAAFEAMAINAVYIPFELRDPAEFIRRMVHPKTRELDWKLSGLSVTAPHKTAVMDQLDWVEPAAREIGAVNTIVVAGETLRGYNTDAASFLNPLLEKFGHLQALRCAVIGSGGIAHAASWALRNAAAEVTLFARNAGKAEAVGHRFGVAWKALEGASFDGFDVVINATPLGTAGSLETETPATAQQLSGARLVYDLVYNPSETRFLGEAREAGCETLGGLSMFVAQAAAQFELWTGVLAPESVMYEAAERGLSGPKI